MDTVADKHWNIRKNPVVVNGFSVPCPEYMILFKAKVELCFKTGKIVKQRIELVNLREYAKMALVSSD